MKSILLFLLFTSNCLLSQSEILNQSSNCRISVFTVNVNEIITIMLSSPSGIISYNQNVDGKYNFQFVYSERDAEEKYEKLKSLDFVTFNKQRLLINFNTNNTKLYYNSRNDDGDSYFIRVSGYELKFMAIKKVDLKEREDFRKAILTLS